MRVSRYSLWHKRILRISRPRPLEWSEACKAHGLKSWQAPLVTPLVSSTLYQLISGQAPRWATRTNDHWSFKATFFWQFNSKVVFKLVISFILVSLDYNYTNVSVLPESIPREYPQIIDVVGFARFLWRTVLSLFTVLILSRGSEAMR